MNLLENPDQELEMPIFSFRNRPTRNFKNPLRTLKKTFKTISKKETRMTISEAQLCAWYVCLYFCCAIIIFTSIRIFAQISINWWLIHALLLWLRRLFCPPQITSLPERTLVNATMYCLLAWLRLIWINSWYKNYILA